MIFNTPYIFIMGDGWPIWFFELVKEVNNLFIFQDKTNFMSFYLSARKKYHESVCNDLYYQWFYKWIFYALLIKIDYMLVKLTNPGKIFGSKYRTQVKLKNNGKLWYLFLSIFRLFLLFLLILFLKGEWTLFSVIIQFRDFPDIS